MSDFANIEIKECRERLISAEGHVDIDPFWLDNTPHIHDVEGKFYHDYIHRYPEFGLSVRERVLEKMLSVQQTLPSNWRLVLRAGYRPLEVQQAMFTDYTKRLKARNPTLNTEECIARAELYISNPQKTVPPHVSGGAIDVDVYDTDDGCMVDMGGLICELSERSHCLNALLNDDQRKNQTQLIEAMCVAGFAPFETEWWHFSYGDQRWASYYGKKYALYGNATDVKS